MNNGYKYPGNELAFFEKAQNWKKYFSSFISRYIGDRVLEVGAGAGATSKLLNDGRPAEWLLLEPDESLASAIREKIQSGTLPSNCRIAVGTLETIGDQRNSFDTIIYIDVLEHIEKDSQEMQCAMDLLKTGGYLVILSPAYQVLYSEFDKALGHYRRYTRKMMREIAPATAELIELRYLDTVGFFASLANKLLLHQQNAKQQQVSFWDRYFIPVSRITDKLLFYSFGRSILGVWKKI